MRMLQLLIPDAMTAGSIVADSADGIESKDKAEKDAQDEKEDETCDSAGLELEGQNCGRR